MMSKKGNVEGMLRGLGDLVGKLSELLKRVRV